MKGTPRAFATLDLGAATTAAALVGRVEGRWRLLGSLAGPSEVPVDRLLALLGDRVHATDPALAEAAGVLPAAVPDLPRLVAASRPPGVLALLAASDRALQALATAVARSGWRWLAASADRQPAHVLTGLLLDPGVSVVVVGAGDPPGGDERAALPGLVALVAAAVERRPELTVVLAGSAADLRTRFGLSAREAHPGLARRRLHLPHLPAEPPPDEGAGAAPIQDPAAEPTEPSGDGPATAEPGVAATAGASADAAAGPPGRRLPPIGSLPGVERPPGVQDRVAWASVAEPRAPEPLPGPRVMTVPRDAGEGRAWPGLTEVLAGLRRDPTDARHAIAAATAGLAGALDRRLELLEVGLDGGLRAAGEPGAAAGAGRVTAVHSAAGAIVPRELTEGRLETVMAWSTLAFDRHRLRDRLLELRAAPWAGASGDGARLRLAAARAALARLAELTPDMSAGPTPDLVVVAGGAFATAPGPAVLLAVADAVRRPAAVQVAWDHARLLGPLGAIRDAVERDRLIADLAGDLLVPLGAVVMPGAVRSGRRSGRVVVEAPGGTVSLGLDFGALEAVPVAPGRRATVLLESAEPILLGARGRRISVEVAGGLGGVLVDLRDVPLRLPDRREARRELLGRWQQAAWPEAMG